MAQERTIPGCPWAFADDMRGMIDKKEFRYVTIDPSITGIIVQILQLICIHLISERNKLQIDKKEQSKFLHIVRFHLEN